jgi:glycerophosphoryl diester phosphodiesterase
MSVRDLPAVIGHRGAMMWAPENTLASFRKAAALGAAWVEFDVRLSEDGHCIVLHDDALDRTTSMRGRVDRLSLEALRGADAGIRFAAEFAGERVPTLEETIALLDELGLGANIEIKPAPGTEAATARAIVEVLQKAWPKRLPAPLLSSFKDVALAAARDAAPGFARGLLLDRMKDDWRARLDVLGCVTLHCDHRRLDRARAGEIVAAGVPLLCYTVNDPARGRELWEWGVTSMITDCPDRLLAAAPRRP